MTLTNIQPVARLILSAGIIFGVLAAVAGASSALLTTNTVEASPISISSASPDVLRIANEAAPDTPGEFGTGPITFPAADAFIPGETKEFKFWLQNVSGDDIDLHLFADVANQVYDGPEVTDAGDTDLDTKMNVSFFCNVKGGSVNDGGTAIRTLSTWGVSESPKLEQFVTPAIAIIEAANSGDTDQADCTMTVTLDESATSGGHTATFDALFTGEQVEL